MVHYGEKLAQRSETRLDDVLVPIVNQFAPIVIFVVGGAAILQYLGVRLDALLVAIGGAAFILAFALQDILSNVFSGLSLLVDTPFRYGDLVRLEDGTTCQVVKIGVRVTQLFDIDTHAVIYMPNSKLANERLINLMQPTPELISSVNLVVGRQLDVEKVRSLLNDVLDGHPDLVGDVPTKLKRIETFEVLSPEKRRHGMERLRAEMAVERRLLDASGALRALAQEISESEAGGFSKAEWEMARQRFEPLAQQLGELPGAPKRLEAHRGTLEDFLDQAIDELPADSLSGLTWSWVRTWARDPDIVPGEDDLRLRQQWAIKILGLWRRVGEFRRRLDREEGLEQRLDDSLLRLSGWLAKDFKQPVPAWKLSVAVLRAFGTEGCRSTCTSLSTTSSWSTSGVSRESSSRCAVRSPAGCARKGWTSPARATRSISCRVVRRPWPGSAATDRRTAGIQGAGSSPRRERSRGIRAATARPRWLRRFFSSRPSSARVRSVPSTRKIRS